MDRFLIQVTKSQHEWLRKMAYLTRKSKSKVIRDLIDEKRGVNNQ